MNILLSGAGGFLGSSVKSLLESKGFRVFSILNINKSEGRYIYVFDKKNIISEKVNIDVVIHAGALTPKSAYNLNRIEFSDNISNTYHLLRNLPNKPSYFLYISSLSVFDSINEGEISEKSKPFTHSLYGLSKLFCEKIVEEFCTNKSIDYSILRFGPIYGENNKSENIVNFFLNKILIGEPISVYDNGDYVRQFIHISDACRIVMKSIIEKSPQKIINITGSEKLSINDIVKIISDVTKKNVTILHSISNRPIKKVIFDTTIKEKIFGNDIVDLRKGVQFLLNNN